MKRMIIKIVVVLLAAAAIAAIACKIFGDIKGSHHGSLLEYSVSSGGGMTGGFDSVSVRKVDEQNLLVSFRSAEWHNSDTEVREYFVPASLLPEIEKIFDKCKMYRYPKLGNSKFFALDAPSTSYSFYFEGHNRVNFGDYQNIPMKGYEGLKKISELIKEATASAEQLPGLVLPKVEEDAVSYRREGVEGELILKVCEYSQNSVNMVFLNGTDEDIELADHLVLYMKKDGGLEKVYDADSSYTVQIYANSDREDYFHPEKRLEVGTYVLKYDTLETEFEIR